MEARVVPALGGAFGGCGHVLTANRPTVDLRGGRIARIKTTDGVAPGRVRRTHRLNDRRAQSGYRIINNLGIISADEIF